jgi:hypothetical protein
MIKRMLLSLVLVCCCVMSASLSVQAGGTDILRPGAGCGGGNGTDQSAVCTDTGKANQDSAADPLIDRLQKIADIVAFVAGAAAILLILVGSIQYITSAGDSNKVSNAKNTIIYALIGLIVIVLAASIITFVVGRINP